MNFPVKLPYKIGIEGVSNRDMKPKGLEKAAQALLIGEYPYEHGILKITSVKLDSCSIIHATGTVECEHSCYSGSGFYEVEERLEKNGKVIRAGNNMFIVQTLWGQG